jgi:hypothetical protein
MKRLLGSVALLVLAAVTPASAEVTLLTQLSGTGNNVVFNSVSGDLATALLNGQNNEIINFRDLTGSTTFTAQASGNDIKISGSNNLFIEVHDQTDNFILGTTQQVFSLNGTGDATAFVRAVDANGNLELFQFDLGTLSLTKPSNFTLLASDGEIMTSLRIADLSGSITSFEHYRIDVGVIPTAAVPEMSTWIMMILGFAGVGFMGMRKKFSEMSFRFA